MTEPFGGWDNEVGCFDFLGASFDLYGAKRILREKPRPSRAVDVADWSGMLPRDGAVKFAVQVDWEKAKSDKVDLTVPVIIARVSARCAVLIDGWHRIAKAHLLGHKTVPGVILLVSETKEIWIQ